jgi:hypothetical protein
MIIFFIVVTVVVPALILAGLIAIAAGDEHASRKR